MSKFYFRFGTVGSAKTLNLLAVAHSYQIQKKSVLLMKPALDTRFGSRLIKSRAGLEKPADYLLHSRSELLWRGKSLSYESVGAGAEKIELENHLPVACILVDEAQFLCGSVIEQLHQVALVAGIAVICYGLKTNFKGRLFEGSQRILELADHISEVKSTCHFCERKATFNLKFNRGLAVYEGPELELGSEEVYKPACKACYDREIKRAHLSARTKTNAKKAQRVENERNLE